MKAIETEYKGCRFRSRLEARWAVFFDSLGTKWVYEGEGFELEGGRYLPDFWLPEVGQGCFVEIKPGDPTDDEIKKCEELASDSQQFVMMFCGQPWPFDLLVTEYRPKPRPTGLRLELVNRCIQENEWWLFHNLLVDRNLDFRDQIKTWRERNGECPISCNAVIESERHIAFCEHHNQITFGATLEEPCRCDKCGGITYEPTNIKTAHCYRMRDGDYHDACDATHESVILAAAYEAARSARFEFGESGARA